MANLGFPFNFEGPLTEGQLGLWSEEYRLDSERRAEEARIAETEARERGDMEAVARARCDGQRAETINLALIAADALGRAGVKGQVGVQDEYWLERDHLDEWRGQQPTRLEKAKKKNNGNTISESLCTK